MAFFPKKTMEPPRIIPGAGNSLPTFNYDSFQGLQLIGAGSYGDVYRGNCNGNDVCIKLLKNSETSSVLREARFLYKLSHKNIVKFHAVDSRKNAIMMEFLQFDFSPYGLNETVSNVSDFLNEVDVVSTKNFEHVITFIADQLLRAILYLHSNNVAHRDLKPSNILISNRKCNANSNWYRCEEWCEIKLSDYGESWVNIVQSCSVLKTHTSNVFKGTPAYMAPEVLNKKATLSEDELKKADIWSFGMVIFSLLNPDSRAPFFDEAYKDGYMDNFTGFVREKTNEGEKSRKSGKYALHQSSVWLPLEKMYEICLVEASKRPDAATLHALLDLKIKTKLNLKCHQGTALEAASQIHVVGGHFKSPDNDGTNACSFLVLKLAELINDEIFMRNSMTFRWEELKNQFESIIANFPTKFNPFRNIESYCPDDAYKILVKHGLLKPCDRTFASVGQMAFTTDGINDIEKSLETDGMYIFTMEPYTFLYGKMGNDFFIVDSHAVPEALGGSNNGLVLVFSEKKACVAWILQRCYYVNPKLPAYQEALQFKFLTSEDPFDEFNNDWRELVDDYVVIKNKAKCPPCIDLTGYDEQAAPRSQPGIISSHGAVKDDHIIDLTEDNSMDYMTQEADVDEIRYFGRHSLPFVKCRGKLPETKAYELVNSEMKRCQRIPQNCKENAVFLINSKILKVVDDIKNDMMTFSAKNYETKKVTLEKMPNGRLIRRRVLQTSETIKMYVSRNENKDGLIRNIVYFFDGDKILNDTIVLQYYLNYKVVPLDQDSVAFEAKPHGNAKTDRKFHPVKKSTIIDMKRKVATGDRVRDIYMDYNSQNSDDLDYGDLPRNRKQLYNVSGLRSPMNEASAILAFNSEYSGGEFVWSHLDFPADLWVLGTQSMKNELKYCAKSYPVSVDPTFNFGAFEVTPITYKSHIFETKCKNTNEWRKTLLPGPVTLHHAKDENTYEMALGCCSRELNLEKERFGVLTDGEPALINAIKKSFKKAIHGRCTNHFNRNCKDFIGKHLGEISQRDVSLLMDIVFGDDGLVEASDKKDLKKRMTGACQDLDSIEIKILNKGTDYKPRFSGYIKENEDVLRRMVKDVRVAMGLPLKDDGLPVRIYTNLSECMNSMLKAKKTALGYGQRTDIMKYQFIKVIKEKEDELKKAVYAQSDQHRLSPKARYLEFEAENWFAMSTTQQDQYLMKTRSLSLGDLDAKKNVHIASSEEEIPIDNRDSLSVSLDIELPRLFYADQLEKKALLLLNSRNGITLAPTLDLDSQDKTNKIYLVAAGDKVSFYRVKVTKNNSLSCTCKHIVKLPNPVQ